MRITIMIDGVLRAPGSDAIIPTGRALYLGLCDMHRVHLLSDDADGDAHWLRVNKYDWHMSIETLPAEPRDRIAARLDLLARLRASAPLDLVIDPDPAAAAALLAAGYAVMLPMHPTHARAQWRPDYDASPRPWNALVDQVERYREAAVAGTRPRFEG